MLASCGATSASNGTKSKKPPLKVAYLFDGSVTDGSFNHMNNDNRLAVKRYFGARIQTTYKENVPQGPGVVQIAQQFITEGYKLIFATSAGWTSYLDPLAKANPGVRFEEFSGTSTLSNFGTYQVDLSGANYVTGMMLAAASRTGTLGFVGSFPIPPLLNTINATELGARAVNPHATIKVSFVDSFYSPPAETQAAQALISSGVDAIIDDQNDAAVCVYAQSKGVPCVGNTLFNGPSYGPTTFLTDFRYNWFGTEKEVIQDVLTGHSVPHSIFPGYRQGAADFGPLGASYDKWVSTKVRGEIKTKEAALKSGSFHVYSGPITDRSGTLRVRSGATLSTSSIESFNWVVQGVIGTI